MSRREHLSLYYADDKDIYDLLTMSKQVFKSHRLLELARERGIVLSADDSRETLIKAITLLPFSWRQLLSAAEATERAVRREKITTSRLGGSCSAQQLETAIGEIRSKRSETRGEIFDTTVNGTLTTITIKYSELDATKTRLCQRVQREIKILVEHDTEVTLLRHEDTERAREIVQELISELRDVTEKELEQEAIALSGIRDPQARTQFFLSLIGGMQGMKLDDVKSVRVNRFEEDDESAENCTANGESDVSDNHESGDDEQVVEDGDIPAGDRETFAVLVKQAALHGQMLHLTEEYKRLTDGGFFVSKIVWTATEGETSGIRGEFEAEFGQPVVGVDFHYLLRGVFDATSEGDHKRTRRAPSQEERNRLGALLENAAQSAMKAATQSFEDAEENSDTSKRPDAA